jgi:hypothetical protein
VVSSAMVLVFLIPVSTSSHITRRHCVQHTEQERVNVVCWRVNVESRDKDIRRVGSELSAAVHRFLSDPGQNPM